MDQSGLPEAAPAHDTRRDLSDYRDAAWRTGLWRSALIGVLAASVVAAPLAILRALTPWRLDFVLPLAFLVALEGVITADRLGRPEWRDRRGLAYRLGEIVCLALIAQLAIWAFSAGWPAADEIATWLRHPGSFISAQGVAVVLLLLTAWALAVGTAGDFLELAIRPDEVAAQQSREWGEARSHLRASFATGRSQIVARFAMRWAWGGLPLVLLSGLSRLTLAEDALETLRVGLGGMGLSRDVLVGLLCYFLSGLLLLSDARLAVLRGRWFNEGVGVAPPLLRRWHVSGLAVLLAIAALALLLPLGSTGPLATALEWLAGMLAQVGMFLLLLLSFLVSVLLYPVRWIFRRDAEPAPVIERLELPSQVMAGARPTLPAWAGGAVLWAVVGLVAGYLLLNFLRAQGWPGGYWGNRLEAVRFWWRSRRSRLGSALRVRVAAWRGRARRGHAAGAVHRQDVRRSPSRLPARDAVRYFYLRAVERAAARGLARPDHVTPLEYASDLESGWPDATGEVRDLTDAFLDARYAAREIGPDEVRGAQGAWRRLMRALQRRPGAGRSAG